MAPSLALDHSLKEDLSVEELFLPSSSAIPIIHPSFKELGRIWVPTKFILRTAGYQRYQAHHPHSPSLCVLFQSGKCKLRERCNQIHVSIGFIARVSNALASHNVSTCCPYHGAPASTRTDSFAYCRAKTVHLKVSDSQPIAIPKDRINATFFWDRLVRENRPSLFFPVERLCKLHQLSQCKFGAECKNVHLCRDLWHKLVGELGELLPLGFVSPSCSSLGLIAGELPEQQAWPSSKFGWQYPLNCATPVNGLHFLRMSAADMDYDFNEHEANAHLLCDDRSPLGPVGPTKANTMQSLEAEKYTPTHIHDSLFMSFPTLLVGIGDSGSNSSPSGSLTPDTLPSTPWTPSSSDAGSDFDKQNSKGAMQKPGKYGKAWDLATSTSEKPSHGCTLAQGILDLVAISQKPSGV